MLCRKARERRERALTSAAVKNRFKKFSFVKLLAFIHPVPHLVRMIFRPLAESADPGAAGGLDAHLNSTSSTSFAQQDMLQRVKFMAKEKTLFLIHVYHPASQPVPPLILLSLACLSRNVALPCEIYTDERSLKMDNHIHCLPPFTTPFPVLKRVGTSTTRRKQESPLAQTSKRDDLVCWTRCRRVSLF